MFCLCTHVHMDIGKNFVIPTVNFLLPHPYCITYMYVGCFYQMYHKLSQALNSYNIVYISLFVYTCTYIC